jgi:hypothetical protein
MRLFVFALGVVMTTAQPADVPLQATFRPSADGATTEIELTNTGTRRAVAWSLRIEREGRRQGGITSDAVWQLARDGEPDGLLPPNQSRVAARYSLANGLVETVVPVAVVYDDNTAIGEVKVIDEIFARRREQVTAYDALLPMLDRLGANVTPQTLRFAAAEIFDPNQVPSPDHSVRRGIAHNLELVAKAPDPVRGYAGFVAYTRRLAETLRAHSVRR